MRPLLPGLPLSWLLFLVVMLPISAPAITPEPAVQAPRAVESLLLDVIQAGERYVAVGERGHVLISEDGSKWSQAEQVPVQATLTRLTFSGGRLWAVGHDSTIIHSRDMGETWELQNFDPELEMPLLDVLFLDSSQGLAIGAYGLLLFTDDAGENWEQAEMMDLVVSEAIEWPEGMAPPGEEDWNDDWDDDDAWEDDDGAWEDNDEAWEDSDGAWEDNDGALDQDEATDDDWMEETDPDQAEDPWAMEDDDDLYDADADFDVGCYEFHECHLNAITRLDEDRLFIVAERGFGYRSEDRGETWESIRFPYPGSMFGVVTRDECLIAFGLRGHVQKSCDFGDSWEILETDTESSLMGGIVRDDGTVVMVAADANILFVDPDESIRQREHRRGSDLSAVVEGPDGLILVGEDGIQHE